MKVYGQLEKSQLENLAAAPSPASLGMVYWDTTLDVPRIYDGAFWRNLIPVVTSVSANGTENDSADLVQVDLTAAAITRTLPTAVGRYGKIYRYFLPSDSVNALTVAAAGSELINGQPNQNISGQYGMLAIMSNNVGWVIL
jgi:hypothetical protein